MLPQGFNVGGIHSGIAKKKEKKDLALFVSDSNCVTAGMFTANLVKAAPVVISLRNLKLSKGITSAVVANSGCANACTGSKGLADAKKMCSSVSEKFGMAEEKVLVASTGVIGKLLPIKKIENKIDSLSKILGTSKYAEISAVKAIMTTDTVVKISEREFKIGKQKVRIWGCVKGAGMIHPDLKKLHATMLSFILTDAKINRNALEKALTPAVNGSFNCVSVDGDTSTNDTVLVLANGIAGNKEITGSGKDYAVFADNLNQLCLDLAKQMAKDGEGATKLVEIRVINAAKAEDAKKLASTLATSPLFKTAIFGNDANWGRIMAAAGRAGVKMFPERVNIKIGNILLAKRGLDAHFSEQKAKSALRKKEVLVTVDLNMGEKSAKYFTCDLSFDYVKINASYRS